MSSQEEFDSITIEIAASLLQKTAQEVIADTGRYAAFHCDDGFIEMYGAEGENIIDWHAGKFSAISEPQIWYWGRCDFDLPKSLVRDRALSPDAFRDSVELRAIADKGFHMRQVSQLIREGRVELKRPTVLGRIKAKGDGLLQTVRALFSAALPLEDFDDDEDVDVRWADLFSPVSDETLKRHLESFFQEQEASRCFGAYFDGERGKILDDFKGYEAIANWSTGEDQGNFCLAKIIDDHIVPTHGVQRKMSTKEVEKLGMKEHIQQLRDDIDNPDAYLVFADWLQEQGHPWGQLIVLQHELEKRPGDGAIAATIESLLKKNKWNCEIPEYVRLDWRWGCIRHIRLYVDQDRIGKMLKPLLKLPMIGLVESCTVIAQWPTTKSLPEGLPFPIKAVDPTDLSRPHTPSDVVYGKAESAIPAFPSMKNFDSLHMLECWRIAGALPTSLASSPLEYLDISYTSFSSIPDAIWGIESLGYILMYDSQVSLNMAQVNHLLAGFVRAKTPKKQRIFEAGLLQGKPLKKATEEQLLMALDNNVKSVRQAAIEIMSERWPNHLAKNPIKDGSEVVILGKMNLGKKSIQEKVTATSATMAKAVSENTTHVILGELPKGTQHELSCPIVLELHLASLLQSDTAEIETDTLADDLRSRDNARIAVAVKQMEAAGQIPSAVLPELFWVLQDTDLNKSGTARKKAQKLFAALAPAKLRNAIKKHMKTSVLLAGESKREERLLAFEKTAGSMIDMRRVAQILAVDHGGLKYLMARGNEEDLRQAVEQRISGKTLDLSHLELNVLPDLTWCNVEELLLRGNHFTKFPKELEAMKHLTTVDFHGNYLRTLPRTLRGLTSLRSLNLGYNRFEKFPKGVLTIPNLEALNLNSDTWGETRITSIPPKITALTKLTHFEIENNKEAVTVPPEMAQMTSLKHFAVTWKGTGKAPASLLALFPNCKLV